MNFETLLLAETGGLDRPQVEKLFTEYIRKTYRRLWEARGQLSSLNLIDHLVHGCIYSRGELEWPVLKVPEHCP